MLLFHLIPRNHPPPLSTFFQKNPALAHGLLGVSKHKRSETMPIGPLAQNVNSDQHGTIGPKKLVLVGTFMQASIINSKDADQ